MLTKNYTLRCSLKAQSSQLPKLVSLLIKKIGGGNIAQVTKTGGVRHFLSPAVSQQVFVTGSLAASSDLPR